MKKFQLLMLIFFLASFPFILNGCGNKDLSFDQAKEIATQNSNLIADLIFNNESPTQQDISLTTTITDGTGTAVDLTLTSQSQQDKATNKSKANITFDASITNNETSLTTSGAVTALLTTGNIFLNIEKF